MVGEKILFESKDSLLQFPELVDDVWPLLQTFQCITTVFYLKVRTL